MSDKGLINAFFPGPPVPELAGTQGGSVVSCLAACEKHFPVFIQ